MAAIRMLQSQPADPVSLAQRMDRLRQDASRVAFEHTNMLLQTFDEAASLADQIAQGGEAYHVGVREIARRAQIDLAASVLNLRAILKRAA